MNGMMIRIMSSCDPMGVAVCSKQGFLSHSFIMRMTNSSRFNQETGRPDEHLSYYVRESEAPIIKQVSFRESDTVIHETDFNESFSDALQMFYALSKPTKKTITRIETEDYR